MATISIITPVYNGEAFIGDAIGSVLRQKATNWELVIVDDGSSDNTVEVVNRFIAKDDRVKLIRQTNAGPAHARANGVRNSVGEWIVFLDADDELLIDAIDIFNKDIERRNSDIFIYSHEDKWKYYELSISPQDFAKASLVQEYSTGPVCKLFKKDLFDERVFNMPKRLRSAEDWLMNIRIAFNLLRLNGNLNTKCVSFSKEIVYKCRWFVNDKSLMKTFKPDMEYQDMFYQEYVRSVPEELRQAYSCEIAKILSEAYHHMWRKCWMLPQEAKQSRLYELSSNYLDNSSYKQPILQRLERTFENPILRCAIDIFERGIGVLRRTFVKPKHRYYE